MYIGAWQEYKQAQVLKAKNDLMETQSRLGSSATVHHSKMSSSSTKTIFSEPFQRVSIDEYYTQWRKVEQVLMQVAKSPQKPVFPSIQVRKRTKNSVHLKRVNKLREIYGISHRNSEKSAIGNHPTADINTFCGNSAGWKRSQDLNTLDFRGSHENLPKSQEKPRNQPKFEGFGFNSSLEDSMSPENVNGLLMWAQELPDEG